MLGAAGVDVETACQMEAEEFAKLFGSPINRALLNVFFLTDRNKKDPGVAKGVEPRKIASAGVVGAGIMGQGIAAANVKRGIPVALMDADQAALARGVQGVLNEVSYNKQIKGPDVKRAIELAPLVNGTLSDIELCHSDIVVEAIIEKPRRQAAAVRAARAADARRRDPVLEHVDDSDHATGRGPGASGAILRAALLQSGAADAAGGSDPRQENERRHDRHRRRVRQDARQVADRDERRTGLSGQSAAAAVHERGGAAACAKGPSIKEIERAAKDVRHADGADHAVRRGRASTWPFTPAARWLAAFPDRVVPAPIVQTAVRARPHRAESRPRASSITARRKAASRRAAPTAPKSPS